MFAFIITEALVLGVIIILLLLLSAVWPPDSPWAPWWQMPEDVIVKMCDLAKITSKDTVYDLGCGTGKALVYVAKRYGAKGVGIEIDPVRFTLAKWNIARSNQTRKVKILKKNFFDVSIAPATIIFVYLVPKALQRLTPKFLKELESGTKFISFIYPMPEKLFHDRLNQIAYDTRMKIYIYQLSSKS